MTTDFGRTFTGGPDLAVRCTGPDGVAVGIRSTGGTLRIQPCDPTVAVDLQLRASEFDPLVLLTGTGGHREPLPRCRLALLMTDGAGSRRSISTPMM